MAHIFFLNKFGQIKIEFFFPILVFNFIIVHGWMPFCSIPRVVLFAVTPGVLHTNEPGFGYRTAGRQLVGGASL